MGQSEFQRRGFDGDEVSRLLYNKKDADNYNDYQIYKLQINKVCYLAKITAVNSAKAKKKITERQANGLPSQHFVCVDSTVLFTKNLKQAANIINGSVGFVKYYLC